MPLGHGFDDRSQRRLGHPVSLSGHIGQAEIARMTEAGLRPTASLRTRLILAVLLLVALAGLLFLFDTGGTAPGAPTQAEN